MHQIRSRPRTVVAALLAVAAVPTPASTQTEWTRVQTTGVAPAPRRHHVAAYDAARSAVVLFGGLNQSGILGGTWELSLPSGLWTQPVIGGAAPSPRYGHRMVYDPQRNEMILFGGWTGTAYVGDTWRWTSAGGWTPLAPSVSPSGRYFPALTCDERTGEMLLFGGYDGTVHVNDTWRWNGTTWAMLHAGGASAPSARREPGLAIHLDRDVALLFGGLTGFTPNTVGFADTWEWNGVTWTQRAGAGPSARGHSPMVFDSLRRRVVLRGGNVQGNAYDDTWEWDGAWTQRTPAASPPMQTAHALVWDSGRQRTLAVGGGSSLLQDTNEVWAYQTSAPAAWVASGTGCGPGYVPTLALDPGGLPWVGTTFRVLLGNLPPGNAALMALGFSDTAWTGGPLPFPLAALGASGCSLLVSPDVVVFLFDNVAGTASWTSPLLPAASLGVRLHVQGAVLDAAANALGVAVSGAGRATVGAR